MPRKPGKGFPLFHEIPDRAIRPSEPTEAMSDNLFLADRFNTCNLQKNAHSLSVPEGQQPGTRQSPIGGADS
jgi:hypothetical protein